MNLNVHLSWITKDFRSVVSCLKMPSKPATGLCPLRFLLTAVCKTIAPQGGIRHSYVLLYKIMWQPVKCLRCFWETGGRAQSVVSADLNESFFF